MRLYLGSREYRPEGFRTVDLDPTHHPDIVADVTDLSAIDSGTVHEICASHILEHIAWPLSFAALAEWARVLRPGGLLRVAVPDLGALAAMIAEGQNAWWATGLVYGLGRIENKLEAHQYGYTRPMLIEMLRTLGFANFDWWKHDLPDASNGWMPDAAGGRIGISLNIAATKLGQPTASPERLLALLRARPLEPFDQLVAECVAAGSAEEQSPKVQDDPRLAQRLHFALIDARMRIRYLEDELGRAKAPTIASPPPQG